MMVIRQRIEELTGEIAAALKELGFTGPVGRQVVLTGGGAELKNIADYMQGVLGRAVRVGRPRTVPGLPDAHSGPAFSTLVGLALLAASAAATCATSASPDRPSASASAGMFQRLMSAMRGRLTSAAARLGGAAPKGECMATIARRSAERARR